MIHALRHAVLPRRALLIALCSTAATLALWLSTGARGYTTFHMIELVEPTPGDDDLFANTGLYDTSVQSVRETRGFRLGLVPTPRGLLDPHILSVLTLLALVWAPFALLYARALWRARCRDDSCVAAKTSLTTRTR